jgi:hypothetical protein
VLTSCILWSRLSKECRDFYIRFKICNCTKCLCCVPGFSSRLGGLDFSQPSKGNYLFSAATANSTMDYSTKVIEDGVVDSPPSSNHVPQVVSSPSPLRAYMKAITHLQSSGAFSRSSQKLYKSPQSTIQKLLVNSKSLVFLVSNVILNSACSLVKALLMYFTISCILVAVQGEESVLKCSNTNKSNCSAPSTCHRRPSECNAKMSNFFNRLPLKPLPQRLERTTNELRSL